MINSYLERFEIQLVLLKIPMCVRYMLIIFCVDGHTGYDRVCHLESYKIAVQQ